MDEHRIGLKPVLRRVWTPRGQRRIAPVRPRYQGQYLYGFVCPATGQTEWWLGSTVDMALFGAILATWADTVGASVTTPVVLVLDGAGWHRSLRLVVPPGGHLVFLPPYSPELQPAERLWTLTNEALLNRVFASLAELAEAQAQRCCVLQEQTAYIRGVTHFAWWPDT